MTGCARKRNTPERRSFPIRPPHANDVAEPLEGTFMNDELTNLTNIPAPTLTLVPVVEDTAV